VAMADPYAEKPVLDGTPSQDAVDGDGLHAALRAILASGQLGSAQRATASIIVTTTLTQLEAGAGTGLTGGGSLLPMKDVLRLARHAHHLALQRGTSPTRSRHRAARLIRQSPHPHRCRPGVPSLT
jgi:hypothetical protein